MAEAAKTPEVLRTEIIIDGEDGIKKDVCVPTDKT